MALNGGATEPGKIFVGGLSWDTDKEKLKIHFEQYGEVEDSVIMMDQSTGKHRGFGFVTFKNPQSVQQVMLGGPHVLDGKTVDPKPATVKGYTSRQQQPVQQPQQKVSVTKKKIFVGGLPADATEDDVKKCFTKYGPVDSVEVKKDSQTQRSRGFGFVSFMNEESVGEVVRIHFHQVNGKTVEAKPAEEQRQGGQGQHQALSQQQAYPYQTNSVAPVSYAGGSSATTNPAAAAAAAAYYHQYYQYYPWNQSGVSSTGYMGQDGHAMYSQAAGAEGYGGQTPGYSYDNSGSSQTASGTSYPQQTYGNTAATYSYSSTQHQQQQQQRGGYYNS